MNNSELMEKLRMANENIHYLQKELDETNRGIVALTLELDRTKDELFSKEKLAVIGKLAGSVGHELRNPLGVISNSVYYLNMRLKDVDQKIIKHLNIIQKEVIRANRIITDLLFFAIVKEPNIEKGNINLLIKNSIANTLINGNIEVLLNLGENLPLISLDPLKIQQAFQNIIINAIQAMQEEGVLEIKTLIKNNIIEIKIKDTGAGIPKENLKRIFEPLFSTKVKGMGLGLPIAKYIIEQHNGTIQVKSRFNRGSIFTIKLPINEEQIKNGEN